jgi:hypothetical protein
MKNVILFSLILILLSGCMTKRQWQRRYPIPEPDTITQIKTKTEYRDTTVYYPVKGDTVFKTDSVFVDRETGLVSYPLHQLNVDFAYSTIEIVEGEVRHNLVQRDQVLKQTIEKAIREAETVKEREVRIPYPVYFNPNWWEQTLMKMGYVFLILFAGGVVLLLLKIKKPF